MKNVLNNYKIDSFLFLDIGAKETIEFIPQLEKVTDLIAWEPNPIEYNKLLEKYKQHNFKSLKIENSCVSSEDKVVQLHITGKPSMTSVLDIDIENYAKHFGQYNEFSQWKSNIEIANKIEIPAVKLDSYFKDIDTTISYLKLDTQGSELEILKGANLLLAQKKINVLKIEVTTIPVYKNQALFSEIDVFLRNYGYVLVDFITYKTENFNYFSNKNNFERHSSPCGDAIYVLDADFLDESEKLKSGMLLTWLGYKSLALNYLKKANVAEKDIRFIINYPFVDFKTKIKKLIKGLMPPILYNFVKKS